MTNDQLFEFLSNMIGELKDGHVNLSASFDYGRNWSWKEDYPTNFSDTIQRKYLGTDYKIACGLKYRILENNIGYIYCGTFENSFGAGNLDEILLYLAPCNSLIIDVRNNGGGMITSAQTLAARFTNENVLVGYMQHKTGTAHNSFSELNAQYLEPAKGIRWQKKVCVLTNRSTYSAANEFVKYMKTLGATIIGDKTGGGAGMPFSSELPNGWGVRFSACPMYDNQHNSTEFGIDPTIKVDIQSSDFQKQVDTIIETAFSVN
jgi:C-terminal processing protease CtpA/Prc